VIDDDRDPGWRKLMTWTFVALVFSLILTAIGVTLAIKYFDRP